MPSMILALVGLALCLWATSNGYGAPSFSRATIFVGPLGIIANIAALIAGVGLMAVGFGFI
jgi:hypothetical protein